MVLERTTDETELFQFALQCTVFIFLLFVITAQCLLNQTNEEMGY